MKDSSIKDKFVVLLSITGLVIFWGIASAVINSSVIFPSPKETFISFTNIIKIDSFWYIITSSLLRGIVAFIAACLLGIVVGIIVGVNKSADAFIKPGLILIMSTPIVSFILLALIWFKTDIIPIFVAFLMIFPIIVFNVKEGIINIDKDLIEMAKIYRVSHKNILRNIYLPSIMSYLFAGIISAIGIGWKVVVTAEVLCNPTYGIGTSLQTSRIYLDTADVFAWTFIAVLLSFIFEKFVRVMQRRVLKWR